MSEKFFRRLSPSTIREIAKSLSISLRNKSAEDVFELVVLHFMEDSEKFWSDLNLKVLCSIAKDIELPLMGGEEAESIAHMIQNVISAQESDEEEEEFKPEILTQDDDAEDTNDDTEEIESKLNSAIGIEVDDLSKHEEETIQEDDAQNEDSESPSEQSEQSEKEKDNEKNKPIQETGGKQEISMSLKANLRKLRGRSEEGRAIKDKIIKIINDISNEVEGNVDIFTDGYYYETYELRIPGSKIRFFFLANKHNEAPIKLRAFSVSEVGEKVGDSSSELLIETFEGLVDEQLKGWIEERINYFAEEGLKITD